MMDEKRKPESLPIGREDPGVDDFLKSQEEEYLSALDDDLASYWDSQLRRGPKAGRPLNFNR